MNLIYNKKRKEKLNKINNKENDYSLMIMPNEQNSKNKKNFFKTKNSNNQVNRKNSLHLSDTTNLDCIKKLLIPNELNKNKKISIEEYIILTMIKMLKKSKVIEKI